MNINAGQAVSWINQLEENLHAHCRVQGLTMDEQLDFLSEQYHQLYLLHRAIQGHVVFVGAPAVDQPEASS